MNGPIVLNIALCLYGNAFQQNEIIPDFFSNSTAQFCKKIEFSLIRRSLLEKTEKKIIYENPNNFFDKLGALYTQFNLYYESINKNDGLEERMSAGFIGGGGKWNLVSTNEKDTSVWTAFWDVIDQNNSNKKIWGVNYIKTGNQYLCNEDDDNYINNFYSALEEIYNFTIKKNDSAFANCFKNAMTTLNSNGKELFGYHKDLVPNCYKKIEYLLDACQSAWVFGGMGSWNDIWIEDENILNEYKIVSNNLYSSLISTIIQSVNSVI